MVAAALFAAVASSAMADATDTTMWIASGGGTYGLPGSWDNGVPGPTINAVFDLGNASTYTVDFAADGTAYDLYLHGGNVTWAMASHNLSLTNNFFLGFLDGDTASLQVGGGAFSSIFGDVAHLAGTNATLTLSGSGAAWNNSMDITVGREGTGTLTVQNGATMTLGRDIYVGNQGGDGTLLVTGGSSSFTASDGLLFVAVLTSASTQAHGQATITDGATASFGHQAAIGDGGIGTLTVSAGATLYTNKSTSGSGSSGILGVNAGPGQYGDGTATVTGSGSQWIQDGSLAVGFTGKGTLTVSAGGELSTDMGHIARRSGSSGTATITGTNSKWGIANSLYVGGEAGAAGGTGSLTVASGGLVTVGQRLELWDSGTVDVTGGGALTVGSGSSAAGEVRLYTGGTLAGTGSITGTLRNLGGTITPGHSPGTLTADVADLSSGTLVMDITGTAPGAYDVLAVTDTMTLGGTLNIVFSGGFAPQTGDTFPLFSGPASPAGAFDTVNVLGIEPGWGYEFVPTSGGLQLHSLSDGTVPEPVGLALVVLGLGLLVRRRSA